MAQQPTGMTNENGVILTIGYFCNGESFQSVMPCSTDGPGFTLGDLCQDAVNSAEDSLISDLVPILSSDAYVAFIQATGMAPGRVPFRTPYNSTAHPGTAPSGALPSQDCALGVIYQDPSDEIVDQKRIRLSKIFLSGIASSQVIGNIITTGLATNVAQLVTDLQGGWPSRAHGGYNWYRVLDVPKPTTSTLPVKRLLAPEVRAGIYTQKRRLVPRFS